MTTEDFEQQVNAALDQIPGQLLSMIDNCVILVEDDPPEDVLPGTLGLYSGVPLTERDTTYSGLPDQIFIFRRPLLDMCWSVEELVDEIRITVVHEIAHHFGIDDARLHELGYG